MKCYAARLGDCGGGISKEHYISESVLKIAGGVVRVSGFPWQGADESKYIGIGSLTAKILCEYHNSQLSPLDASAKDFLQALKSSFDNATEDGEFTNEVFYLEGDKIELWLLKILCGLFPAFKDGNVPEKWIDILFEQEPFSEGHGLHFFGKPGDSAWFFQLVRVIFVLDKNRRIAGAKFGIGGLPFLLAFGGPNFSEEGISSVYRPESLVIKKETKTKTLKLSWGGYPGQGSIILDCKREIDAQSSEVRPMVRPRRFN